LPALKETPLGTNVASSTRRAALYLAVALLFIFATFQFVRQDVIGLKFPVNDLAVPWVSSQAFLHGKNPYDDMQEFAKIWAAAGVPIAASFPDYSYVFSTHLMAYPPTALALVAPLGLLGWHTAVWAYAAGSMVLFVAAILLLAQNLPLHWRDPRKLYFVAFALAMAPLRTGSQDANLNTLTIAFVCLGVGLMSRKPYWSGIAIALAACLKPQVAVLLLAYMLLRSKWRVAGTASAVCAVLSASSILWMRIHGVDWFRPFLRQVSQCVSPTGINAFVTADIGRFDMVNLRILTFQLTQSLKWSGILAWAVFALLAAMSVFSIRRHVSSENENAGVAIVAVLTLLPTYQRFYGAEILLFVVYWAVENWSSKTAKAALLLMLPLLFPFIDLLKAYQGVALQLPPFKATGAMKVALPVERFIEGHNLDHTLIWNGLLMPHVVWIELSLLALLLFSLHRMRTTRSVPSAYI
jgi:hypothetical protein